MILTLYCLSTLSILISSGGILIGLYGSRFEGGAGFAGGFTFLLGSGLSLIVAILLYKQWAQLGRLPKVVGGLACFPFLMVLLALAYVLVVN